ncbi:uncharacterized protein METZ01_LOCUS276546, partial [marine metagenome]
MSNIEIGIFCLPCGGGEACRERDTVMGAWFESHLPLESMFFNISNTFFIVLNSR